MLFTKNKKSNDTFLLKCNNIKWDFLRGVLFEQTFDWQLMGQP